MSSSPQRGLRATVYTLTAALAGSGVTWLLAERAAEFGNLAQDIAAWCRPLHGMLALVGSIAFGSLVAAHALPNWRKRKPRMTGVATMIIAVAIILTGGLLYYIGSEILRDWASTVHWAAGLLGCLALSIHAYTHR